MEFSPRSSSVHACIKNVHLISHIPGNGNFFLQACYTSISYEISMHNINKIQLMLKITSTVDALFNINIHGCRSWWHGLHVISVFYIPATRHCKGGRERLDFNL